MAHKLRTLDPTKDEREQITALIASGALKITRCPAGARQWDSHWDVVRK